MKVILALIALLLLAGGGYLLLQRTQPEAPSGLSADTESKPGDVGTPSQEAELLGNVGESAVRVQESERSATGEGSRAAQASPDGSAAKPHKFVGKVIDEQGQPIEGVEVRVEAKQPDEFFLLARSAQRSEPNATTNAQGEFQLDSAAEGSLQLTLNRPEYVPSQRPIHASDSATIDVGTITMAWAMILEGRIVDERGAGIPGVSLRLPSANESMFMVVSHGPEDPALQTKADGSFRLDTLAPGPWRFWLHSANHCDRIVAGEMPRGLRQSGLLWTLEDGLTLRGRVLGVPRDEGTKLAVRCRLKDEGNLPRWLGGSTAGFMLEADSFELDRGLDFELRGLHAGAMYTVGVLDAAKATNPWVQPSEYLTDVKTVAADAGEITLDWVLRASLRLRVVDSDTKAPLEKVRVTPKDWDYFSTFADAQATLETAGTWRYDGIPVGSGKLDLILTAKGYTERALTAVPLQKGQCTDLGTVELVRGDTIQVRVTSATTGAPVAGAALQLSAIPTAQRGVEDSEIEIDADGMMVDRKRYSAHTDDQGVATLQFLPGVRMDLRVQHERYATSKVNAQVFDAYRETPFEVAITEGGSILCKVVDADGAPAAGKQVQVSPIVELSATGGPGDLQASIGGGIPENTVVATNAQGTASFGQLAAGDYRCKIKSEGMLEAYGFAIDFGSNSGDAGSEESSPSNQRVTVLEGEVTQVQLVAPTLGTIEGTILEDGQPLVGAKIAITEEDAPGGLPTEFLLMSGGGKQARTDAKGAYRLENIQPGKKILTISHDMRVMPTKYPVEILEGNNPFSVNLSVTIVAGRAVDAQGRGIAGVTIDAIEENTSTEQSFQVSFRIQGDGGETFFGASGIGGNRPPVVSGENGEYRLRGVVAGKPIRITGKADGFQECKTEPMVLPEGAIREGVELRLLLAGKLLVTVQHANRDPWEMAALRLEAIEDGEGNPLPPDPNQAKLEFTNEQGLATFDRIAPGKYRVVFAHGTSMGPNDDSAEAPKPQTVEVEVRTGGVTEATMKP